MIRKKYLFQYITAFLLFLTFPNVLISADNNVFTVVIDAGHGGKDTGAIDNNVKEKDINLGVAKQLEALIKKKLKNVKVVMTRDNDTFISLQERANIANANKGNLFISIHTNSVDKTNPNRQTVSGTSVYALGLHKDQNNLKVAQRENSVIELEKNFEQKYSGFDPSKDESYIIFEMAQKKNLGQSLKFANAAQQQLVKVAGRKDRGVKQAGFWVLWATSMPAVLVELDFICNPNSAKFMGSETGQKQLAEALFKAVESYQSSYNKRGEEKVVEETAHAEETIGQPVAELAKATKTNRVVTTPPATDNRKSTTPAKRRRRSIAAKNNSVKRSVETPEIILHSEGERMAMVKKNEEKVEADINANSTSDSDNKAKAKKNKKAKAEKKRDDKKNQRTYNNKKIVIAENKSNSPSSEPKKHKAITGYHSKVEKLTTIYKIQILASPEQLSQKSPQFCGLTPVKYFKENNLYKYTYGESESKKEIEALLKDVKKVIPDAFIITGKK